ncbi:MAG TPA: hypothetical protein VLB06_09465 [Sulfuricaulis sp.]|nr:hypothetical protein [Sulfuricaulis sp.]
MLNSKLNIALYALMAMLAIAPTAARAASCGGEPSVSSASSFQTWKRWCSCMGGTSASNLNDAQRQGGCRLPSGSSSSSSATPGGSIGTIIGTEIGKELGKALFGDPEADARRKAQAELRAEEQRRAAEEANRKLEEQKNRLLGGMMDVENTRPLGLMDVESGPGLSLMTDSTSADTPSAKAVPPAGKKSSSYTKGFEHASQCISQNAGSACAGVTAGQQQACVADYRGGYDSGSKQRALVLQEAYQAGKDAAARGELANGASDPRAVGSCRTDWIMAYNNGHFGAKSTPPAGNKPAIAAATKGDPEVARIINEMNALAKRLGWSADEQDRLATALKRLGADGEQNVTDTQIRRAWQDVLARGRGGEIARAAAQGDGPGLSGAGKQSFEDCTIFALANASGLPYSVVAARATKLIGEGEWREAAARANPQKAIEQKGLIGGEVVMLAEAFGQAEVVPSSAFAKTLKEGRPVMVNVVPENGNVEGGHEVVLARTFQHGGETWYEMMDSNQGPQRRLYLSSKELNTMLQENGVAFRPDPGTTPKLSGR